jgi:hypothetical protein
MLGLLQVPQRPSQSRHQAALRRRLGSQPRPTAPQVRTIFVFNALLVVAAVAPVLLFEE